MQLRPSHWQQQLDSEATEEYQALRRSLARNRGFGLFFVQCSPATGSQVTAELERDLSDRKIAKLEFNEPIDSLYHEVSALSEQQDIDILFISGLEHSLIAYENYTWGTAEERSPEDNIKRLTQAKEGVPRFLGYLNLQRDRFRDDFDFALVFIVPIFGIDYFIKRAPDFFDWRSGLFRFIPQKEDILHISETVLKSIERSHYELLDLKTLQKELEFDHTEHILLVEKKSILFLICERYEEAITSYDKYLAINPRNDIAWLSRSFTLRKLKRYEEAITSYDKCLAINPQNDIAWHDRGFILKELERYEEAITSYDKCLAINPQNALAWYSRGIALCYLGRYEETIISCDQSLLIDRGKSLVWLLRGMALGALKRDEEAVLSYSESLEINPKEDIALYHKACCLATLNKPELALESLTKAINLDNAWREKVNTHSIFELLSRDRRFQELVNPESD